MKSIWGALAMFVAGLALVVLRPMFRADGSATSVYEPGGALIWIGWLLLVVGAVMLAVALWSFRKR